MQVISKNASQAQAASAAQETQAADKPLFTEPKLTFVEPKLVKHGDMADVTFGFFGTFYPQP